MSDKKSNDEDGVTFKIPNRILLYAALALGGGGTAWNKFENVFLEEAGITRDQAAYETLAKTLAEVLDSLDELEERLHVLETGEESSPGRRRRSGARSLLRGGGSGALGVSRPGDVQPMMDVGAAPPVSETAQTRRVPSYDMVRQMVEAKGGQIAE